MKTNGQKRGLTKKQKGVTMCAMERTHVFLTTEQKENLKRISAETGAPVSVSVRKAIDLYLDLVQRHRGDGYYVVPNLPPTFIREEKP